jgi:hypothetical protein
MFGRFCCGYRSLEDLNRLAFLRLFSTSSPRRLRLFCLHAWGTTAAKEIPERAKIT